VGLLKINFTSFRKLVYNKPTSTKLEKENEPTTITKLYKLYDRPSIHKN
jgi:hypothetical protein